MIIYLVTGELVGWDYMETWIVHGYSKKEIAEQRAKDAEAFYDAYQLEKDECWSLNIRSIKQNDILKNRIDKLNNISNPFDDNKEQMNHWINSPDAIYYKVVEVGVD
jgi:hypothetical protein